MYKCILSRGRYNTGQNRGVLVELWKQNIWECNSNAEEVGGMEWRPWRELLSSIGRVFDRRGKYLWRPQ